MRRAIGAAAILISFSSAAAQQKAFEVSSVKLHPADQATPSSMIAEPGGRFTVRNIPLRMVIRTAYQIQDDQIVDGPAWIGSDRFDITAKAEGATPLTDLALMIQALLAERFKFSFHRETRELPIFELQLARADAALGPKMKKNDCVLDVNAPPPAPGGPPRCGSISNGFGRLTLIAAPIPVMAQYLAPSLNRVVIDRTGLTGNYDVDLTWTPDRLPPRAPGTPPDQPIRVNGAEIDPNGPSIFTAVREQLGLKLESARAPLEVLVIDHIEHPSPD
jgi:bla regulator protein blaR1